MTKQTTSILKRVILVTAALALPAQALPCGDKLMVVARGQRAAVGRNAPHRGAILLYANPGGSVSAALSGADLKKGLERAGHRVRTVTTRADLRTAVTSGSYDLVLADLKAVSEVEADVKAAPSGPTVIPTLFDPSAAELAAAHSDSQCVVQSKDAKSDYLSVVNEALTLRAKTQSARKDQKKG